MRFLLPNDFKVWVPHSCAFRKGAVLASSQVIFHPRAPFRNLAKEGCAARVVGQFESKLALSVPKNAGRRGLYKTMSPLYGLPL